MNENAVNLHKRLKGNFEVKNRIDVIDSNLEKKGKTKNE